MNLENYWLCWSAQQNHFHIESEAEGLRINKRAFERNGGADYIPIGVYPSRVLANKAAVELRHVLNEREKLFGHPALTAEN